ncbi:hypothetical protein KKJ09_22140, partial [Xenorhabdus bovienii]|nr:hypothetical protein [Xenorhabdus bovienii]MDE9504578.1 hypothetical protein [Xenorhabdus bovienii]MDE9571473.1 hypothetical protein [Xenorhabdus bovienii]
GGVETGGGTTGVPQ